jgi:hypothetical protein
MSDPKIFELRKNGCFELLIRAQDSLDVVIMEAMAIAAANNPAAVKFSYKDGVATVTVERR